MFSFQKKRSLGLQNYVYSESSSLRLGFSKNKLPLGILMEISRKEQMFLTGVFRNEMLNFLTI